MLGASLYLVETLNRLLIEYVAAHTVNCIGGVTDDAAVAEDINRLVDEPLLRVVGVYVKHCNQLVIYCMLLKILSEYIWSAIFGRPFLFSYQQ